VVAGVVLLVASGCGLTVREYDVSDSDARQCAALVRDLPDKVEDLARRDVKGSPYAAAWGDRPIVLRCGVGKPVGYDRFSPCQTVNGIGWFIPEEQIDDDRADILMTTVTREPRVEVLVPASYRPKGQANAMVDLEPAIKAHTAETTPCQ
jgi:hypothetical protein